MTGPTHELIGLTTVCYFVLTKLLGMDIPLAVPLALLLLTIVGSELPDVDQPANRLSKQLGAAGWLLFFIRPFTMGHRNLTHSFLGIALVGLLMAWLRHFVPVSFRPDILWLGFMVAYVSHVAADFITTEGVPLLFPLQRNFGFPPHFLKRLRVNTGGFEEYLIVVPIVGFTFVTFVLTHRVGLLHLFHLA